MPRAANPYYSADAGNLAPVGQGLTNLASVFAPPSALDSAKVDALAWDAKGARSKIQDMERTRQGQEMLGDIIAGYEYGASDPRHLLSTGVRYGQEANELGNLFRVMSGNLPGATDETRMGALVGAGSAPGLNTAVSLNRQNELLDIKNRAEATNKPPSRDQVLADLFLNQGPDAANAARPILYGEPAGRAPVDPLLQAKRRGELEADARQALEDFVLDMGASLDDIPNELRTAILPEAMQMIETGGATPSAAVSQLLKKYGVRYNAPWLWANSLEYDLSGGRPETPPVAPAPAAPAGIPPANQRVPGQVYDTPRGPMIWTQDPATGQYGWMSAQG